MGYIVKTHRYLVALTGIFVPLTPRFDPSIPSAKML